MEETIKIINELIFMVISDPSISPEKKNPMLKYLYGRLSMAEYELRQEKS